MAEDSDEPKIFRTPAGKCPAPSSVDLYNLSDHEEEIEDEDEQPEWDEVMEHAKEYRKDYAKRLRCDEEYEGSNAHTPDLASYFAQFELPNFSVIAICRTYANYLAQQERSKNPKVRRVTIKKN